MHLNEWLLPFIEVHSHSLAQLLSNHLSFEYVTADCKQLGERTMVDSVKLRVCGTGSDRAVFVYSQSGSRTQLEIGKRCYTDLGDIILEQGAPYLCVRVYEDGRGSGRRSLQGEGSFLLGKHSLKKLEAIDSSLDSVENLLILAGLDPVSRLSRSEPDIWRKKTYRGQGESLVEQGLGWRIWASGYCHKEKRNELSRIEIRKRELLEEKDLLALGDNLAQHVYGFRADTCYMRVWDDDRQGAVNWIGKVFEIEPVPDSLDRVLIRFKSVANEPREFSVLTLDDFPVLSRLVERWGLGIIAETWGSERLRNFVEVVDGQDTEGAISIVRDIAKIVQISRGGESSLRLDCGDNSFYLEWLKKPGLSDPKAMLLAQLFSIPGVESHLLDFFGGEGFSHELQVPFYPPLDPRDLVSFSEKAGLVSVGRGKDWKLIGPYEEWLIIHWSEIAGKATNLSIGDFEGSSSSTGVEIAGLLEVDQSQPGLVGNIDESGGDEMGRRALAIWLPRREPRKTYIVACFNQKSQAAVFGFEVARGEGRSATISPISPCVRFKARWLTFHCGEPVMEVSWL